MSLHAVKQGCEGCCHRIVYQFVAVVPNQQKVPVLRTLFLLICNECCRVHVPAATWQSSQAVTVDTSRGAIDLEPATEEDYTIWVLGLNAVMTVAQNPQTLKDVPVAQMLWHPDLFILSN